MRFKENYNVEEKTPSYYEKIRLEEQRKKELKKETRLAVMRAGQSQEVKDRVNRLLSNPTSRNSYTFHNPKDINDNQSFHGIEYTEYDAIEGQKIIHGTITVREYDSNAKGTILKTEDIYVYQPRFEGTVYNTGQTLVVGPKYRSDNTLDNRAPYSYKDAKNGNIYIANIPKRELISNRQFDFDLSSRENFDASCSINFEEKHKSLSKIIGIRYDRDPAGYIKTVNLQNPEEKAKLDNYIAKMKDSKTASSYLEEYLSLAKQEFLKVQEIKKKMEKQVHDLNISQKIAESQEQSKEATKSTINTAEQNEQMMNELLKKQMNMMDYGIRPTYASPGMGRRPGGPMPMGPGPGGVGFPPPPEGGGRRR